MAFTVPETEAWMLELPRSFSLAMSWPTVTCWPTSTTGSALTAEWEFMGETGSRTSLGWGMRTGARPAVPFKWGNFRVEMFFFKSPAS